MARRRSKRSVVRGKPNYLWISSAGSMGLVANSTARDTLLLPADWSGTVTETQCTLLRMVLLCYTTTLTHSSPAHSENAVVHLDNANDDNQSAYDISVYGDWPDFFAQYDRVLRIFRLEWAGELQTGELPVQFSQLPEPAMNLKTPRVLKGDDVVCLSCGGNFNPSDATAPQVVWFCRSLVRTGLR